LLERARYFVFGSLAARSKVSRNIFYQLLDAAPKKVLDVNLRAPHFKKDVIEALLRSVDILKLNDDELKLISSWYSDYKEEKDAMQLL
jgi:fructokinase